MPDVSTIETSVYLEHFMYVTIFLISNHKKTQKKL